MKASTVIAVNPSEIKIKKDTIINIPSGSSNLKHVFKGIESLSLGAGYENKKLYLHSNGKGKLGVSEYRPLLGITRETADRFGIQSPSDISARTNDPHFDYESPSGIVWASHEGLSSSPAYGAFRDDGKWSGQNNNVFPVISQYKFNEPRIALSWRLKSNSTLSQFVQRITWKASNDGLNWTDIDTKYSLSGGLNFQSNGGAGAGTAFGWSDLQKLNSQLPYRYFRLYVESNGGDTTWTEIRNIEINTISPADYFLMKTGKMHDKYGSELERTYIGELTTNHLGEISHYVSYSPEDIFQNLRIEKDLKVFGDILNDKAITLRGTFDGNTTPATILYPSTDEFDVVNYQAGGFNIIPTIPFDNEDYTVITKDNIWGLSIHHSVAKTRHSFVLQSYANSWAGTNSVMEFIVIGGRKIL